MSSFASVKLSSELVNQARESAQTLRRSVASQIEYWATLGQVVEHAGLTVQEAQQAIAGYEAARGPSATTPADPFADDPVLGRFMAAEADDSLANRVRQVIASNHAKATALKVQ